MALYFAARGQGKLQHQSNSDGVLYTSSARVLLNGLGSDELFGGYGRHRTAFTQPGGGWHSVIAEVTHSLNFDDTG